MNPLVSLIVPVYNAMPYFEDFLKCVADQTWRPLECVFADDGSEDGSTCCLEKYIPIFEKTGISVKYLTLPHRGQAAAVNSALKEVTGEFLTWCDADDIMMSRSVEAKVMFLLKHPELGLVRSDGLVINGDTGELISHSAHEDDRHTQRIFDGLLEQKVYCYAGCYMVRMSLFCECYPKREIPISPEGQNLQLLLPPASRSECGFVPDILHKYYRRTSGHSSRKRSYTESLQRARNFIELSREIIKFCDCDREYYNRVIDQIWEKNLEQLKYSALIRVREEIKKNESRDSHIS